MEGSRHERVVVMITSYAVGFATAFIIYGVTPHYNDATVTVVPAYDAPQVTAVAKTEPVASDERLVETLAGLFYNLGDTSRLLSANAISAAVEPTTGFHVSIVASADSADGRFVYFCEQQAAGATECHPFVYNAASDSVFPVQVAGEAVTLRSEGHDASWSPAGRLQVQDLVSLDTEQPWVVQ